MKSTDDLDINLSNVIDGLGSLSLNNKKGSILENLPPPPSSSQSEEKQLESKNKDKGRPLRRKILQLRPLTLEENKKVKSNLYEIGPQYEIISEIDNDSITRQSMQRLRNGAWLNDEVIHFYFTALSHRNKKLSDVSKKSHFFKSFFITKLLEETGGYNYKNVKRWSKRVEGKNIFALDKLFFPINIHNNHWALGCIFMTKKCIRFCDSMGGDGMKYLKALLRYLKDEWRDKHESPRDDWDDWKLAGYTKDIPQQQNSELFRRETFILSHPIHEHGTNMRRL